jgi:hypothetical protein
MTKLLSELQTQELLTAHCYSVLNKMDHEDLLSYAMQMMSQSFDKNPGQFDVDVDALIEDIWEAQGENEGATELFIANVVGHDIAEKIMETTQYGELLPS